MTVKRMSVDLEPNSIFNCLIKNVTFRGQILLRVFAGTAASKRAKHSVFNEAKE